jgi:hypothetical protein
MFQLSKSKHPNLAKVYSGASDLYQSLPMVKHARQKKVMVATFKTIAYLVILIILLFVIFLGSQTLAIRAAVNQALDGKKNLESAASDIRAQNFRPAILSAVAAEENFRQVEASLELIKLNKATGYFPGVTAELVNLEYLTKTGVSLARTVAAGASFGQELKSLIDPEKSLTYSKLAPEEKKRILGKIYQSAPELIGIKANLDLSLYNLGQVRLSGILWPLKSKVLEIKNLLQTGSALLTDAIPLSQILPSLAGYPDKATFLVLLQNSDELRPTGGFLGTYGILEIEYGDIIRFETHDIYHMDMPVKDLVKEVPPYPIKQYLNPNWYMRDANWSPDWPTAAKEIQRFYTLENKLLPEKDRINRFDGEFDGMIAITPEFVTDLLAETGPIRLGEETFTAENFTDLLEYRVEKGYAQLGIPSWQRKEVIGDILKELKIRLLDLPSSDWPIISNIISDNLLKKNILMSHRDPLVENLIKEQGWGGELKDVPGDYFMVVDANLASLKTDAVMSRSINYSLEERPQGLYAKLTVSYAHRGQPDWKTSAYKTYTRVYVPRGSKLIKADGNLRTEVYTGEESGKAYFGALLNIDPGEIGTLYLEYKLPDRLKSSVAADGYRLYVQRQPGTKVEELQVDLKLLDSIKSYDPIGFSASFVNDRQIDWQTDLNTDKTFELSIK